MYKNVTATAEGGLSDKEINEHVTELPLIFIMTVCTVSGDEICTHGIFSGDERIAYEDACRMSIRKNVFLLDPPARKCIVYLNPGEYKTTWIGNKAVYRSRMAIADGGELIVLVPGFQTVEGEEIYFIENPMMGLWFEKSRIEA